MGQPWKTYLVVAVIIGLLIGAGVGWLSKPPERVEVPGVTVTVTVPGPTVTKTVTPTPPTPTTPPPKKEIKVLMLTSPAMLALKEFIPRFEEKFGISVVWEDVAYADIHTKTMHDFVAHTGYYDVIQMDNPWLPEYAGGGYIENLEPYITKAGLKLSKDYEHKWPPGVELYPTISVEDELIPLLNFYGNWKGDLYCMPNMPGVQLMYARSDLFNDPTEKANFKAKYGYDLKLPTTWDELKDVAEFFTRKKGETLAGKVLDADSYGLSWSAGKGNMAVQNYYNVAWSWGSDCMAFGQGFPDPKDPLHNMPVCNNTIGVKALEFFVGLKPFMPPGVAAYEWDEITRDYCGGKAAMMFQWSDFVRDVEDPTKSVAAGKTLYALLPGNPDAPAKNLPGITPGKGYASLGGWGLVMNKDSKDKDSAWTFLAWASCLTMTDDEMVEYLNRGGTNTGRARGYELPETIGYKVGRFEVEVVAYEKYIRRRPAIAEEVEYEVIVGTEAQIAFVGEKTPKKALDDACLEMYDLMVRGGYIPKDMSYTWPSKYMNPDGTLPG